ncbi:hypothetical protein DL96DRAFT_1571617 [Flagelloscypha sp. PMI_526]|nr:hypothetical protein DL96DRAFT_1571617 [Flagelloscypha sp. PMI_526]
MTSHRPNFTRLQSLLQKPIQIESSDGRVFVGLFAGTDKLLNILLANAEEYKEMQSLTDGDQPRYVGQILVPWKLVVKVHAEDPEGEKAKKQAIYI